MPEALTPMASWLLTYLVHSTVWLGAAWLLLRRREASPGVRELGWRAALCGSLLTPTAQVALAPLGWEPLGGTLQWSGGTAADPVSSLPLASADAATAADSAGAKTAGAKAAGAASAAPPRANRPPLSGVTTGVASARVPSMETASRTWPEPDAVAPPPEPGRGAPVDVGAARGRLWAWMLGLWLAGGAAGLAQLGCGAATLRRRLRDRRSLRTGPLVRALQRQLRPAGRRGLQVRLSVSDRLPVPIAFGWRHPEICLPERALRTLDADQQRSMLGHELCHLLRRDPLWLSVYQVVQRVLFLQPLNALARREALAAAEETCDAWSARRTGRPDAMAGCLAQVADWFAKPQRPLAAACMSRPGSPLGRRIERLLDPALRAEAAGLPRRARVGIATALCGGLALVIGLTPAFAAAPRIGDEAAPPPPGNDAGDFAPLDLAADAALARERARFLETEIDGLVRRLGAAGPNRPERAAWIARLEELRERLARVRNLLVSVAPRLGADPNPQHGSTVKERSVTSHLETTRRP